MRGSEETEKDSVIRYTEFEKRIIEKSSNLYREYYLLPWGGYRLSYLYVGLIIVFSLIFLGLCLWEPTVSSILFLGSWLFSSIHYLLGVLITQFRARRRIMLFSALLVLSLSGALFFSSVFFHARPPPDIVTQAILTALFMILAIFYVAPSAYVLVQAYRGKYDRDFNKSIGQQYVASKRYEKD